MLIESVLFVLTYSTTSIDTCAATKQTVGGGSRTVDPDKRR